MSGPARLVLVERGLWDALQGALPEALGSGSRRALGRLAAAAGLSFDAASHELSAFPGLRCGARDPLAAVRPAACTAGGVCPVEDECALVAGGGASRIAASALAALVLTLVEGASRPAPPAPFHGLAGLVPGVQRLLAASGKAGPEAPPRTRTALAVLDLAVRREGILGATGPFLAPLELEQVCAFVPPGSGRGDAALAAVEAWLRRVVCDEAALLELR